MSIFGRIPKLVMQVRDGRGAMPLATELLAILRPYYTSIPRSSRSPAAKVLLSQAAQILEANAALTTKLRIWGQPIWIDPRLAIQRGTIDYIARDTVVELKTSAAVNYSHVQQATLYSYLASRFGVYLGRRERRIAQLPEGHAALHYARFATVANFPLPSIDEAGLRKLVQHRSISSVAGRRPSKAFVDAEVEILCSEIDVHLAKVGLKVPLPQEGLKSSALMALGKICDIGIKLLLVEDLGAQQVLGTIVGY